MQETEFGTGLVGTNPGKSPVHIHVDDNLLATEGARTFEQDSTVAAWTEWHCKHVKTAQIFLFLMSSIQLFLGLTTSYAAIGILPLVSSILGFVSSVQYFMGDVSSLKTTLNWVRLPAALMHFHCNRTRIDSFFLIRIPGLYLVHRIATRAVRAS
jgi:hypothetical protein